MGYVVTATRKGKRIKSQEYKTRKQAQKHVDDTKNGWKGMFTNPRIKKVK